MGYSPPPHTRIMFMLASTDALTRARRLAGVVRDAKMSSGIMFVPLANTGTPLTLKYMVSPGSPPPKAEEGMGLRTKSIVRRPTRRERAVVDAGADAGSYTTSNLYSGCAPYPTGHHTSNGLVSLTSSETTLVPARSVTTAPVAAHFGLAPGEAGTTVNTPSSPRRAACSTASNVSVTALRSADHVCRTLVPTR
jgi:hypothetical protein